MRKQFNDIAEMKELVVEELSECNMNSNFICEKCCELEQCYTKATSKSSHKFAESIDYGGYDTEEEFWESLD